MIELLKGLWPTLCLSFFPSISWPHSSQNAFSTSPQRPPLSRSPGTLSNPVLRSWFSTSLTRQRLGQFLLPLWKPFSSPDFQDTVCSYVFLMDQPTASQSSFGGSPSCSQILDVLKLNLWGRHWLVGSPRFLWDFLVSLKVTKYITVPFFHAFSSLYLLPKPDFSLERILFS